MRVTAAIKPATRLFPPHPKKKGGIMLSCNLRAPFKVVAKVFSDQNVFTTCQPGSQPL